jgi:hypothetical protein
MVTLRQKRASRVIAISVLPASRSRPS